MDLINIGLLVIFIIDLILILISLADNERKDRITLWYIINVATIALWVFGTLLFRASDQGTILFNIRNVYVFASLVVSSFYYFSLIFPKSEKKYHKQIIFITLINLIIIYLTLFTNTIIVSANARTIGENEFYPGSLYILYIIYTVYFLISSFARLYIKSFYLKPSLEKSQLFYLASGYTIAGLIVMPTNLILPWLGESKYDWIGPFATLTMIVSFTYAVSKYKLFNIKVISAEIIIFALWIFTAIRTFIPNQESNFLINIGFLILTAVVGLLLIRSVKNEVKQREKLKELDELKSEFISLATHHISSPLTAINGYVSLIQEGNFGEMPKEMREITKILQNSTQNLTTIVRDFLDISKIERVGIIYNYTTFDLKEVVREVSNSVKHSIKNEVDFNFNYDVSRKFIILADKERIYQALRNILENSIKYTSVGYITINLKHEKQEIILTIEDTGERKLPIMSQKMAQKFTQSTNQNESNIIGNGLGIYVSKQIIEAQKGRFFIEVINSKTKFNIIFTSVFSL